MPDQPSALFAEISETTSRGLPIAMATVVATNRSVPRHASSRMVVHADGSQMGTIGGGEMEASVVAACLDVISSGHPRLIDFDLVDPSKGDFGVCGGTVSIYVEAFMPEATIFIVGCGHVGKAVVELAHWLGYRVIAADDRVELATADLVPDADVIIDGPLSAAIEATPITANTDVVVVTRSVQIDLEILPLLLASNARSVGVMGSRRRWATTRAKLAEAGVPEDKLDAVRAPIGIELNAETPAEIAMSILSEIVLDRNQDADQ